MSGMTANATKTIERPLVDQLIPPVPSTGRRITLSAIVLGAAIGLAYLTLAGWLYPRLTIMDAGYSGAGNGVQAISIEVTNPGHRSIIVDRVTATASGVGIPGATVTRWPQPDENGAAPQDVTLPHTLGPTERITVSYDVVFTDCENGIATLDAQAEVAFQFADGPPSIDRSVLATNIFEGMSVGCDW